MAVLPRKANQKAGKAGKAGKATPKVDEAPTISSSESDYLDKNEPRKKRRVQVTEDSGSEDSGSEDFGNDDSSVDGDSSDDAEDSDDSEGSNGSEDKEKTDRPIADPTVVLPTVFDLPALHTRIKRRAPISNSSPLPAAPAAATIRNATTFEGLGIQPWLAHSLSNVAIRRPTAAQKACIPAILDGRDCLCISRTGSGKTMAFAAPMVQAFWKDPCSVYGLVLTATRELASQIYEQFQSIGGSRRLEAVLVTGGADMCTQANLLGRRPHVIIATPGRLAEHILYSGEDTMGGLRRLRVLVLDEVDRLLAPGHGSMIDAMNTCLEILPPPEKRQTLMFTATITDDVMRLRNREQRPGQRPMFTYEADTQLLAVPETLNQRYLKVPLTGREHYLHALLQTDGNAALPGIIVFCNHMDTVTLLHHLLRFLGHSVTALSSRLRQHERNDNLGRFRATAARILVATDVAARGLDIPEVRLVINYDVPRDPDDYIHRVGRTARAGRSGTSVTFVGPRDIDLVHAIEARVGRQMTEWEEEGVNLDTRVVHRDTFKLVNKKKREALLDIEEDRGVTGKRKHR